MTSRKKISNFNQRIFILSEPRAGSSWLMKTLNSHEEITLLSELYNHAMFEEVLNFHQIKREEFYLSIDYLEKKFAENNKYIGCKILLNQLNLISTDFPVYFIERYKNSYFIFLYRENEVAAYVSLKIAHTYKIWHLHKTEDIKKRTVHIDPMDLRERIEENILLRNRILGQLDKQKAKIFKISYEELFLNREKSITGICNFLNVSEKNIVFSSEKKSNPFVMEEIIENFEEVSSHLKKYPCYHEMLFKKANKNSK